MPYTGLHQKLNSRLDKAIWEYQMIRDGDKLLVAVSGGADSMVLLSLLSQRLQIYARDVDLLPLYVDMGFGDAMEDRCDRMGTFFGELGLEGIIRRTRIGDIAHDRSVRVNACFLCSRIRRKEIFHAAEQNGCNRIVFAHHKDDLVETLLINLFFAREISTMRPVLPVHNGKFYIIRPLFYTEEAMIKRFAEQKKLPVIDHEWPTDGQSKRQYVKELVQQLERDYSGVRENIFKAMKHVKIDYLLRDMK